MNYGTWFSMGFEWMDTDTITDEATWCKSQMSTTYEVIDLILGTKFDNCRVQSLETSLPHKTGHR